jgi:hypothetical protein
MRATRIIFSLVALCLTFVLVGVPRPAQAATLTVTNLNDSGAGSLRAMIAAANNGDTINFANGLTGTITITSGELLINKALTIQGPGMNALTFTSTTSRIFHVGTTGDLTLTDVAFRNIQLTSQGNSTIYGLGVYNENQAKIRRMLASSNSTFGSTQVLLFSQLGSLHVSNSIFQVNQTTSIASYYDNTRLVVENTSFISNSQGAIFANGGALEVRASIFRDNIAEQYIPGIYVRLGSALIENSQFIGNNRINCNTNLLGYGGGAIGIAPLDNGGRPPPTGIITNSLFLNNQAKGYWCGSGAVYATNTTVRHSTFVGNKNTGWNGSNESCAALYAFGSANAVEYSTFTGNFGLLAPFCVYDRPFLRANVLYNNNTEIPINIVGEFSSGGYNILGDRSESSGYIASDFPPNTNPQFGAIGDNGGNTITVPLLTTSPARNAIPVGVAGCVAGVTDQRGVPRPQGSGCDVGAFELYGNGQPDRLGLYKDGIFYLYNTLPTQSNTPPATSIVFGGAASHLPVAGDWNNDGIDTIGIYDTASGHWHLRNTNTGGAADALILFGNPSDLPLTGRWASDTPGSSIGVYRPSSGVVYLRRSIADGSVQYVSIFGNPNDQMVAGDYDSDGVDTLGVYRPGNTTWYLSNANVNGFPTAPIAFQWNVSPNYPFVWDYDGDALSTVAYRSATLATGQYLGSNASPGMIQGYLLGGGYPGARPISGKWFASSAPQPLWNVLVQSGQYNNQNPDDTAAD